MTGQPEATYNSVELFAGGGGMALGLRLAGYGHHALVELNKHAVKILRHNAELHPSLWPEENVIADDVVTWVTRLPGGGSVDLVAGGPPCQPFSLSGVHAGVNDARNMFPAALEAIRTLTPRLAIFENVPGLTRPSFAPYFDYVKAQLAHPSVRPHNGEMWWEHAVRVAKSRAKGHRYHVYEECVDAADLGVPQCRQRVFLIAVREDMLRADGRTGLTRTHDRDALLYDQWVDSAYWTEHDLPQPPRPDKLRARVEQLKRCGRPQAERWVTLRDALRHVPEPIDGQDHPTLPDHAGIPGARAYKKHTGSPYDWPSKTIKAGVHGVCGGEGMIRYPDGRLRYLTIREAALVQGFPDDYEFPGVRSRVMGVIGNAVAVAVAERIGRDLAETFLRPVASSPARQPNHQQLRV